MKKFIPYLDLIDHASSEALILLETWVNINSWTENLDGISQMADQLKSTFGSLSDRVKETPLQPIKKIGLQNISELKIGNFLSLSKRSDAKRKILLGGHMDTVFPPTSSFWQAKIVEDKMIGPGTADMKGGLIVLYLGLLAFEKSPFATKIGWEIFVNPDEEIGSIGSKKILKSLAPQFDIGILFEPSFSDGAIVGQRKGSANYTIIAKGKAAHVGRDFHLGKSAITALARLIVKLETLQNQAAGLTINIGHIQGGGPVNIVPDLALCKINIRFSHNNDLLYVDKTLLELSNEEKETTGISIEIHKEACRPPKLLDQKTEILYQQFKKCAAELNQPLFVRPTGGVCDGNILAHEGLANLDTMGAIGGNIHTPEEYIYLESIPQRAKLLALFLMNYAEQGF